MICVGGAAAVLLVLAILEWTVEIRLAERTVELAQAHGALPAALSILTGSAAFAFLAWVTAGRLDKKDLPDTGSR